jgi:sec-independent protein translocase protein TatC
MLNINFAFRNYQSKTGMPLDQSEEFPNEKNMSFFDHVDELRSHIIRALIAIVVFGTLAFIFSDFVINTVIFGPKSKDFITYRILCSLNKNACIEEFTFSIINTDVTGQFIMSISIAFVTGIILAFPYVIYEFWRFFKPALKPEEQKKTTGIIIISSLLFLIGVLFGYFLLAPVSMFFMATYSISDQINNTWTIQSYISFLSMLTVATGLIFELPLVMCFLAKLGLINKAFLKKYRRYAILIIVVVAAIVTPPDVGSQILVSIPLLVLYEVGVIITGRVEKNAALKN